MLVNGGSLSVNAAINGGGGGGGGTSLFPGGNGGTGAGGASGGAGNSSGAGGGGAGAGAVLGAAGSVTVNTTGVIAGGGGGGGSTVSIIGSGGGGGGGSGIVLLSGGTVTNAGTIQGGSGGDGTPGGTGGVGIIGMNGAGMTIVNSGTIEGGLNGNSTTARANAITFTGGNNSLELQQGWNIIGNVVGATTPGSTNTLVLGGAGTNLTGETGSTILNVGLIAPTGTQFQNFTAFEKTGASTWELTGTTNAITPWSILGGTLQISSDANLGATSGTLTLANAATLQFLTGFTIEHMIALNAGGGTFDTDGNNATLSSTVSGPGGLIKIGLGTLTLSGTNTYTGGTTVTDGTLLLAGAGTLGSIAGKTTVTSGVLDLGTTSQTQNGGLILTGGTVTNGTLSSSGIFDVQAGTISAALAGNGALTKTAGGTVTLSGINTYTGGTTVSDGALLLTPSGTLGNILGKTTVTGGTLNLGGTTQTQNGGLTLTGGTVTNGTLSSSGIFDVQAGRISAALAGTGALTKTTDGTVILSGINTFTGPTTVSGGTLDVTGSIASSTVTVNSGDTLDGTGTVGPTVIKSGGTLAPGAMGTPGSMRVAGSLAFQSGAFYLVQVTSSTSSLTNVTGTATLAGTVVANVLSASKMTYHILHSGGGLVGKFDGLVLSDPNFRGILSYSADPDVFLTLTAAQLGTSVNLTRNQQSVANALDNFFNSGGTLPPAFVALFGLTGSNLTNALDQVSGEAATGAQTAVFQLGNQFLNVMLDPFVDGRCGIGGTDRPPLGYPPDCEPRPNPPARAYGSMYTKAPLMVPPVYEPHWSVWGAGYVGGNQTSGDPLVVGSHDLSARTAGFATGFDYRLAPNSVVGFALAGGGTNWSLSQGLGGGRSDALQAGIYGATRWGPAYVAADFAFTNHWMSTDRFFAFAGDQLRAIFNAQSYGGRLEGGYRFETVLAGIAPYAAIQAQNFHTPSYSETGTLPDGFALAFPSRDATDTRSELGARFDRVLAVYPDAVLALRGRVAWAHDWVSDPSLTPLFQSLPGASFVVTGAIPPHDSALTSVGAELRFANGIALLAKFDGEFGSHSQTYAGTGTIRYTW